MANEVVLQWAGATDVGRVRSSNQDRFLAKPEVGLWAVADGMGGHQGGETASLTACDALSRAFKLDADGHASSDALVASIEEANRAVHEKGNDDPDLTGMGTTVVALAVVTDGQGDEVFAIANVGDSRAYRYSSGDFEQLTEDHSLVADMVREGSISAEDAATHPQRNILTRVLGVYDEVPVDVITVIPHPGDRFVLCSDGLFNEVTEEGITSVLRRLADPAEAADELVRLAVQGGGRDNITVIVVDVLEDGDRAGAASQALAVDDVADTQSMAPYAGGAYADEVLEEESGATFRVRRARQRRKHAPGSDGGGARHASRRQAAARPRRMTWRVLGFSLLVLGVLAGGFVLTQWYARNAYFVGFDGNDVAIFRGRPGGVGWIDPELKERTSLQRNDLPEDVIPTLTDGKEESSYSDAQQYVDNLMDRVDDLEQEAGDESTTTTTTAPTTTTTQPGGTATTRT